MTNKKINTFSCGAGISRSVFLSMNHQSSYLTKYIQTSILNLNAVIRTSSGLSKAFRERPVGARMQAGRFANTSLSCGKETIFGVSPAGYAR